MAQARHFGGPRVDPDPYHGAYRHCVASCLSTRRRGPLAPLLFALRDALSEDSSDADGGGDVEGEQFGITCADGEDKCEPECLKRYPPQ